MLASQANVSAGLVDSFVDLIGGGAVFTSTGASKCPTPVADAAFNGQKTAVTTGAERYTSSRPASYFQAAHGAGGAGTVITAFAPTAGASDLVLWATGDDVSIYLSSQAGAYHQMQPNAVPANQQMGWFASNGPGGAPPARVLTGPGNTVTTVTPAVGRYTRLQVGGGNFNGFNKAASFVSGALLGVPAPGAPAATMQLFNDTNNATGYIGKVWTWMFTPKALTAPELATIVQFLATGGL